MLMEKIGSLLLLEGGTNMMTRDAIGLTIGGSKI